MPLVMIGDVAHFYWLPHIFKREYVGRDALQFPPQVKNILFQCSSFFNVLLIFSLLKNLET